MGPAGGHFFLNSARWGQQDTKGKSYGFLSASSQALRHGSHYTMVARPQVAKQTIHVRCAEARMTGGKSGVRKSDQGVEAHDGVVQSPKAAAQTKNKHP